MKDFLEDWGKEGYYSKGCTRRVVVDSNGKGGACGGLCGDWTISNDRALLVQQETMKLSFSPLQYGQDDAQPVSLIGTDYGRRGYRQSSTRQGGRRQSHAHGQG